MSPVRSHRATSSRALLFAVCALFALVTGSSTFVAIVSAQTPTYDVTAYGAVGDGKTDCTSAVAAATAALNANGAGGTLYFPKGTYLLSETPTSPSGAPYNAYASLNSTAYVEVKGDSTADSVLVFNTNYGPLLNFITPRQAPTVSVHDFTVNVLPVNVSLPYYPAIFLNGQWESAFIKNVDFNSQVGAYSITAGSAINSLMIQNVNVANGGTAVTLLDGSSGITITNCNFVASEILQTEVQLPIGVDIQGDATNVIIQQVYFSNFTYAINLAGGDVGKYVQVIECEIVDPVHSGVHVTDNSTVEVTKSLFRGTYIVPAWDMNLGIALDFEQSGIDALLANVQVNQTSFNNIIVGVVAKNGVLSVDQSDFTNIHYIGCTYIEDQSMRELRQLITSSSSTSLYNYNLTNSHFTGNENDATGQASMAIITGNTCINATETNFEIDCDIFCYMQNNNGCKNDP